MPFTNPIVGGTTLVRPAINSPNFVTTVAGWSINADGTAEVNQGLFRGSITIGLAPTGAGATISAAVPAVLTAFYGTLFNQITGFAQLVYPGDGSYHYEIAGRDTIQNIDVWLVGWVDTSGTVIENYESIAFNASANQDQFWGIRMTPAQSLFTQFGSGAGAAKVSLDIFQVFDAHIRMGAAVNDLGLLDINVPATIFNTASFRNAVTFSALASITANGSVAVNDGLTASNAPIVVNATSDLTYGAVPAPRGIPVAPTTTTSLGTPTAGGAVEVRDAVLGNYTFTALPGHRYQLILSGRGILGTVANDRYALRVRNGGAATPTTASPLVAETDAITYNIGASGLATADVVATFVPGAGVQTLSAFLLRASGTGVGTPETLGPLTELYVIDIGAV